MKKFIKLLPVLILVLTVGFLSRSLVTVDAGEEKVIPNTVYVGEINISGMTRQEAELALMNHMNSLSGTEFVLTTGEQEIRVTAEDLGISIANLHVVEEALNLGKSGNLIARYKDKKDLENEPKMYDIEYKADTAKIEALLGVNMENLTKAAVDGSLTKEGDTFVIVDGVNGIEVNVSESVNIIDEYITNDWNAEGATITLATSTIEPKGTREQLSKVKDVLGSYGTDYSTSAAGRSKNVENGAAKINGTLIYPGEQFSVYEMVNPFTAENGYELAGSYENGTTVQTYGGGICQVSTTLYNAVIRAELQIDERWNHSMIVTYVDPSMDAAIAGTAKDLKFTNNTEAPIYIEGYTAGRKIYFNIYGEETRPENREVSYVSEVLTETPAGVTIQPNGVQPIGYVSTLQSAHTGYTAKLWKVVTVDGVEESREEFNSSRYNASNKVISVGVVTTNPEAAAQIQAAIATGDEANVKAVAAHYAGDPAAAAWAAQLQAEAAAAAPPADAAAAQ